MGVKPRSPFKEGIMPEINSYDDIARHLSDHQCDVDGYDCLCHKCVCPGYTVISHAKNGIVNKLEQYFGGEYVNVADLKPDGTWVLYGRKATLDERFPISC
jgi:hypothetical protein